MQRKLRPLLIAVAISISFTVSAASQPAPGAGGDVIACRVLESHASEHPAVIAIVFHQTNRADQQRLGALLENLATETVDMQTSDGLWQSVTVARLKSCFGRGLLLLPADSPAPKDGATFSLRFSAASRAN
jgi:hypothetical protein